MSFGETLSAAWKAFWKHKVLWLLGVLPLLIYFFSFLCSFAPAWGSLLSSSQTFPQYDTIEANYPFVNYVSIAFYLIFLIIYFFAYVLATTATTYGALQADRGVEKLDFVRLLREGLPYFWRVFGLGAIFLAAMLVGMILLWGCMMLSAIATMGIGMLCVYPVFFLFLPAFMLGSALLEQSKAAIVVENLGIVEGLKQGWRIFRQSFWKVVLMAIILYVGSYLLSLLLAIPLYVAMFIPMMNSLQADNQFFEKSFSLMMAIFIIAMPFYLAVQGIVQTFIRCAWTITYLRLSPRPSPVTVAEK